jgi:hypothetical protein
MNVLPAPASMNTPRTIWHRRYISHQPAPTILVFEEFLQMSKGPIASTSQSCVIARPAFCLPWQFCFKVITSFFNPGPAWLFLYIVLRPSLFFSWWYFRWISYGVRTIYVTVYKIVITVRERYFILGVATSMGTKPTLISIPTCNISYTTSTYAYTIIV